MVTAKPIDVFAASRDLLTKDTPILERCEGKTVLDVGCVGQDRGSDNDSWLHGKLKRVSQTVHGVDINREGIDRLNAEGCTVFHMDDMAGQSTRYDVIVMADVIEHVDSAVGLLNFYKSFLNDDGCIIVTTPNPFAARQMLFIFRSNDISVNPEHTMWLDPRTMMECVRRSGLTIMDFHWLGEYDDIRTHRFRNRILFHIASLLIRIRPYYSPNMMFVLGKADTNE